MNSWQKSKYNIKSRTTCSRIPLRDGTLLKKTFLSLVSGTIFRKKITFVRFHRRFLWTVPLHEHRLYKWTAIARCVLYYFKFNFAPKILFLLSTLVSIFLTTLRFSFYRLTNKFVVICLWWNGVSSSRAANQWIFRCFHFQLNSVARSSVSA